MLVLSVKIRNQSIITRKNLFINVCVLDHLRLLCTYRFDSVSKMFYAFSFSTTSKQYTSEIQLEANIKQIESFLRSLITEKLHPRSRQTMIQTSIPLFRRYHQYLLLNSRFVNDCVVQQALQTLKKNTLLHYQLLSDSEN